MKLFALTVPAAALLGYVITLAWTDLRPFVVAALALPLLGLSLTVTVLASWRVARALPVTRPQLVVTAPTSKPAPTVYPAEVPGLDNTHAYRQALCQFCEIGDKIGFKFRAMSGHVTRAGWELYVGLLLGLHVLAQDGEGTHWAEAWDLRRLQVSLRHGLLRPHYPNGRPPAVRWTKSRA